MSELIGRAETGKFDVWLIVEGPGDWSAAASVRLCWVGADLALEGTLECQHLDDVL